MVSVCLYVCICLCLVVYNGNQSLSLVVMKKQLDRIDRNAEMLMGKSEISSAAKQKLETAVKVCNGIHKY